MERIESAANGKVKLAAALARRSKRAGTGLFVAEGVRLAEMAAQAMDWHLSYALATPKALARERAAAVAERLAARGCPVYETPEAIYRKAADTETPQGLLVVMEERRWSFEELRAAGGKAPLWVVLDGVQDPGNVGTIVRTADAAGAAGVLCLEGTADLFSPKAVRGTMGSLFYLPTAQMTAADFLALAKGAGWRLYAAAPDATATPYFAADFSGPAAILLGSEGNGVSAPLLAASEKITIPLRGKAESLNVAAAAAVLLYEGTRGRRQP